MTMTTTRTDRDIQRAVLEELSWTPSVGAAHVGVEVNDGAVTLTGEVDSYPERLAARQAAFRVRGVTTVADGVSVSTPLVDRPTDTDIARSVRRMLRGLVTIPPGAVQATVRDGVVTLSGELAWEYLRTTVHNLVGHLRGVRDVVDLIRLTERPEAEDPAERIRAAHERAALLSSADVHVRADGTTAVLTGTVGSWAERREAERAAWSSPHITEVRNDIVVAGTASRPTV
jgi:osmotically-inducible protein OsmY